MDIEYGYMLVIIVKSFHHYCQRGLFRLEQENVQREGTISENIVKYSKQKGKK